MICSFGFFFPPCWAQKSVVYISPGHGLTYQCFSRSFSSGGNAAGREGWQFVASVSWLLHGTFRAACPPSGEGQGLCLGAGRPPCQSAVWLCKARMVRQQDSSGLGYNF